MNIPLDNVQTVEYLDSVMTKGRLASIRVIFGKPGHIGNYFGPGLRLALDLVSDYFPPRTEAERSMVEPPLSAPLNFDIDPNTLELSASLTALKALKYTQLAVALQQAEEFGYFVSAGRSFKSEGLQKAIQVEIDQKKP